MHKFSRHLALTWVYALLALMVMGACNDTETIMNPDDGIHHSDIPVAFSVPEGWKDMNESRGVSLSSFSQGDRMGVFAYYRPSGTWGDDVKVFMNNQMVEYDGTAWKYAPLKYWPQDGDVVFYAYAPYEEGKSLDISQDGLATVDWMVSNDVKKQGDVITSAAVTVKCSAASTVGLDFKHVLARIRFKANESNDISNLKIHRITISSDRIQDQGTLHLPMTLQESAWWSTLGSNLEPLRTKYDFYADETLRGGMLTSADLMLDQSGAFLIPQTVKGFTLKALYEKDGEEKILEKDVTAGTVWEQGKSYTYVIDFSEGKTNAQTLPEEYTRLDYVESLGYYKNGVLLADKPHSEPIDLMLHTNGGHYGVWMKCRSVKYTVEEDGSLRYSQFDTYPFGALTKGTKTVYDNRFYGVGINGSFWQCGWAHTMFHGGNYSGSHDFFNRTYEYSINYKDDNKILMTEYDPNDGTPSDVAFSEEFSNTDYTDSDLPVYIFGMCNSAQEQKERLWVGRIYEARISRGQSDIVDLVPCRKDASTVGLFDLIGQAFYPLQNGIGSDEGK